MAWRKCVVRSLVLLIAGTAIGALFLYRSLTNPTEVRERVLDVLHARLPGATVSLESARLHLLGGISINELHLASRKGVEKAEFAYVPHATIRHDKEKLSKGELAVKSIDFPKAKLHVTRGTDGTWNVNADILAEPDPRQLVPTMVFKQATLVIEDHFVPATLPPLKIRDLDLTIMNDPLPTLVFQGAGTTDLGGKVQVRGSWGRSSHEFALSLEALDFTIGPDLVERLSGCCPQLADHARQLSGIGRIQADLRYRPGATVPWSHDVRFQLSGGKLCHAKIPFLLENLEARCRCTNDALTIEQLTARSGDMRVEAALRLRSLSSAADLDGSAKIEHLSVCSEVFKTLPPKLQTIQHDYGPTGFADIAFDFKRRDGHWRECCLIYPHDASILCAKFPYQLHRVTGLIEHRLDEITPGQETECLSLDLVGYTASRVASAPGDNLSPPSPLPIGARGEQTETMASRISLSPGEREVHINGKIEGKAPAAVDVTISGKDIPIDDKLSGALVKPELLKIVHSFSPAGLADIEAHILRTQGSANFDNRFFIHFHDALMSYEAFPYPIENLSGTLEIRPDYWEFRDFCGTHNGATFRCRGRSDRRPGGGELSVTIQGSHVPLDCELEAAIQKDALKRAWKTLAPGGPMDFEAQVHRTPENPEPEISVTLVPRQCTISPAFFSYPLTDLTGTIYYHQHQVELSKMQARHGRTSVSVEKAKVVLKPDGGVSVDMAELACDPLVTDEDLMQALPPAVRKTVGALQSENPFALRTRLTVDVPEDKSVATNVYWDGELDLNDATLAAGVQMQHVTGKLCCRGSYQGGMRELLGNIELRQASLFGQPLRNLHSLVRVVPAEPDRVCLPNLTAQLFGGDVGGWVRVDYHDGLQYDVNLTASQIKLEELEHQNRLGPKARLSGLAGARLFLHGQGADVHGLEGNGVIDVPNGKMCNLPLLLPLLKVLSLRLPDDTAFEEAHVVFGIHGDRVEFRRLDLYGDAVSLSGQGSMNLNGSDLNLDFFAVWARALQFMPPVIDQIPAKFGQALLKIKMRGDVRGKVECTKVLLPPVVEPLKQFIDRVRSRPSGGGPPAPDG
jgi:hypothetical protein